MQIRRVTQLVVSLSALVLLVLCLLLSSRVFVADSEFWSISLGFHLPEDWQFSWVYSRPLFYSLLWLWALFDKNPPFTTQQLAALCAKDEFEVMDWPKVFGWPYTPFTQAVDETFNDPQYSQVVLEF